MPQRELIPSRYQRQFSNNGAVQGIHLFNEETETRLNLDIEIIRPGTIRTRFFSESHPLPPFSTAPEPEFETSQIKSHIGQSSGKLDLDNVEVNVDWSGVPIVTVGLSGQEQPLYSDLAYRSYALDGPGIAHYTKYYRGDLHVGLGEKPAPMDLSNRHFTMSAMDSFGYDVHRTDPMYKYIPLLFRVTPTGVVATFSTSQSRGYFSVGSEMDGMWGFYKVYRQDYGGLEQYILVGKTLQEVVKLYADIVGYPLLVPRWAFGYLAGGMKYSMLDEPAAHEALMEFADKLKTYDIPCSGFQMSSGYTMSETTPKNRHVFTWNKHRFPGPKAFCDAFHARGIRLIANIKPYILDTHPEYQKLVKAGALFQDPTTGKSGVARLWSSGGGTSGEGGHLDFSSKAGFEFWYNSVKELREVGMDCMWNDNNEYTIPSDDWEARLDHKSINQPLPTDRKDIGLWGRSMHCDLMAKASHDALQAVRPDERPFVLTRSATAGTMRYASSTWSGDNISSWAGMKGANALSLNAGISLLQCYGHDIGGFEGPQPSPELLLRWVQLGIHSPRFAINCFKTVNDNNVGDVIEPWMYPEILPQIRKAIRRRYELMPYIYDLMLQSHLHAIPPQRWVGWGYETDEKIWESTKLKEGEEQYWLGDALMIGGVYEPGVQDARLYLPKCSNQDEGFLNLNPPYQYLEAGAWHTIAANSHESIPVIARIGGAVAIGRPEQTVAPGDHANEANLPQDDWRGVEIFPPPAHLTKNKKYKYTWLEDDGISPAPLRAAKVEVEWTASKDKIEVEWSCDSSEFRPAWIDKGIHIVLPQGDIRSVVSHISSSRMLSDRGDQRMFLITHK